VNHSIHNSDGVYIGRFAPSPTGPLHLGSLVAAMASYLDAKVHHGAWLVRIEDVDETRTVPDAARAILQALQQLGMHWDGEVIWQSQRKHLYQAAAAQLAGHTYPCGCTRREIVDSQLGLAADGAAIYPGTCRHGLPPGKQARTLRLRVPDNGDPAAIIGYEDRWLGLQTQNLATEAGDFVLQRADGFWSYQLAVVVDDALQGVTHVVRGVDLKDSTARQIYLQRLLLQPMPRYLHLPVVRNAQGEKLSKQTGAQALVLGAEGEETARADALIDAAQFLGLPMTRVKSVAQFWQLAQPAWAQLLQRL
jgi:glutamyl-Q tRNA(Asp) synthetase